MALAAEGAYDHVLFCDHKKERDTTADRYSRLDPQTPSIPVKSGRNKIVYGLNEHSIEQS